jgi:hypothetical protein
VLLRPASTRDLVHRRAIVQCFPSPAMPEVRSCRGSLCGTRSTPPHDDRECEHHLPKAQVRPGAGGSTASTIGSKRDGPCRCASLAPGIQCLVQYVCIYSTVLHRRHPGHVGSSILFYRDLRRRQRPVMSASCPRYRTRGTIQ